MDELIDRGALFKHTQDYNLNAIVSNNFHWTNILPNSFFDVKDSTTYPARHHDNISVSKSVTYIDLIEIIIKYTPNRLYIAKPIRDADNLPNIQVDYMKLKNLSTVVYYFDMRVDFLTKYLNHIKYLFVDRLVLGKGQAELPKDLNLPNLENLCVNLVNEVALNLHVPNVRELSLYHYSTPKTKDQTVAHNPALNLENYKMLDILRIDDSIQIKPGPLDKKIYSLQFMFYRSRNEEETSSPVKKEAAAAANESTTKNADTKNSVIKTYNGAFSSDYYSNLIETLRPSELILPPNALDKDYIKNKLKSVAGGIQKLGIYVNDLYVVSYFELFHNSLEIYDYNNPHAAMCLRYVDDLTKYVSRTYTSVVPELEDLVLGLPLHTEELGDEINLNSSLTTKTKSNIACLTNFDLSTPQYNSRWMYIINELETEFQMKPVIITRCEIVKPEKEFVWPSIVWAIKKRVIIMNLQKQSVHLDISATSTNSLIKSLEFISGSFPFKTLIVITHGFSLSQSSIMQVQARFPNVDITIQDVPYVLFT